MTEPKSQRVICESCGEKFWSYSDVLNHSIRDCPHIYTHLADGTRVFHQPGDTELDVNDEMSGPANLGD